MFYLLLQTRQFLLLLSVSVFCLKSQFLKKAVSRLRRTALRSKKFWLTESCNFVCIERSVEHARSWDHYYSSENCIFQFANIWRPLDARNSSIIVSIPFVRCVWPWPTSNEILLFPAGWYLWHAHIYACYILDCIVQFGNERVLHDTFN